MRRIVSSQVRQKGIFQRFILISVFWLLQVVYFLHVLFQIESILKLLFNGVKTHNIYKERD